MSFETAGGMITLSARLWVVREDQILLVKPVEPDRRRPAWCLPAAKLAYGEHPDDVANRILNDLGAGEATLVRSDLDSIVTDGVWSLAFHFHARVTHDVMPGPSVFRHGWFGAGELPEPKRFAGGTWERMLAARGARHGG